MKKLFMSLVGYWLAEVKFFQNQANKKQKIHDYTQSVRGRDYVFELTNEGTAGYMTAVGKGIKSGDQIILQLGSHSYVYQVEEIDYYSDPPDMWIALLKQG
ncbi:hypothetical protein NWP17_08635 [Chrysosporum bergii ANA360D]|uniref:Uncharacterized protein n=1 Tax=Chrysosporum bergii ANA360D TaxID=617107 RepID=A0AA43GRU7_9CYAN|nr:hypothetical protein [Chrysosporum bergii]MDH6060502.1 hypothetical protein [Chrysosporum bergii ANA360D]